MKFRTMPRWVILACAGATSLAAAAALGWRGLPENRNSPSEIIFPPRSAALNFSHRIHLGKAGMKCQDCHAAASSTRSSDNLIPRAAQACAKCHAIPAEHPRAAGGAVNPQECRLCHAGEITGAGPADTVFFPPPHLHFSHKLHLDKGMNCSQCHAGVESTHLATRAHLPKMTSCLACHDGQAATQRCTACHLATPAGKVKTSYPNGQLLPSGVLRGDAHAPGFERSHGPVAKTGEAYCQNCHQPNDCLKCHAGMMKPQGIHPADYISQHAVEARKNAMDCQACHRQQGFCITCHQRTGVAALGELTPRALKIHPSDWASSSPGLEKNAHVLEAQRNMNTCVSCHAEKDCIACHGGKGRGSRGFVNPHPAGFDRNCGFMRNRNQTACLKCHARPDLDRLCPPAGP